MHKLALTQFPEGYDLRADFLGAIERLTRQAHGERFDALTRQLKQQGLSAEEKAEYQALHALRRQGQA